MKYLAKSLLSLMAFTSLLCAEINPVVYNKDRVNKTKEIDLFSQILSDGSSLKIHVKKSYPNERGFFSSMSENTDPEWFGNVNTYVTIDTCASENIVKQLEESGYVINHRASDSLVVAYREAIKTLKKDGAKYILIPNQRGKVSFDENFENFFDEQLFVYDENFRNSFNVTFSGGEVDGRALPPKCYTERSLSAKDVFWIVGQIGSLALGTTGTKLGSANMAALGANTSRAVDYAAGGPNQLSVKRATGEELTSKDNAHKRPTWLEVDRNDAWLETNPAHLSAFMWKNITVAMKGAIGIDYFKNHQQQLSGSVFKVEDVEKTLGKYLEIPYDVKK